MANVITMQGNT